MDVNEALIRDVVTQVLAEVGQAQRRVSLEGPASRRQLAGEEVEQRALALAVLADDPHPIAHLDADRQFVDQRRPVPIAKFEVLGLEQGVRVERRGIELEGQRGDILQPIEGALPLQ